MRVKCNDCNALIINGKPCHETGCNGIFLLTKRGKEHRLVEVWSLDVWGNHREGFEVNDRCKMGQVTIPLDMTDKAIIKALKKNDFISKRTWYSSFSIDDGERTLTIDYKQEPFLQLEIQ